MGCFVQKVETAAVFHVVEFFTCETTRTFGFTCFRASLEEVEVFWVEVWDMYRVRNGTGCRAITFELSGLIEGHQIE